MAAPSRQPMTEVLRGWTVARGIPPGNAATVQNTRHRYSQADQWRSLARTFSGIEHAVLQGAVRILEEFGDLRAALKKQSRCPGCCGTPWQTTLPSEASIRWKSTGSCQNGNVKTTWGIDSQNRPFQFTTDLPVMSCFF